MSEPQEHQGLPQNQPTSRPESQDRDRASADARSASGETVRTTEPEGSSFGVRLWRLLKFIVTKFWVLGLVLGAYYGGAQISVQVTGGTHGSGARWGLGFLFGTLALLFLLNPRRYWAVLRVTIATIIIGAIVLAIAFAFNKGDEVTDAWIRTQETDAGKFGMRWAVAGVAQIGVMMVGLLIRAQLNSRSKSRRIVSDSPKDKSSRRKRRGIRRGATTGRSDGGRSGGSGA